MPSYHSTKSTNSKNILKGLVSIPLTLELATFLSSNTVQKINFDFDHFQVRPRDFRAISEKLRNPKSPMSVIGSEKVLRQVASSSADAGYDSGTNTFYFETTGILRTDKGKGRAIHETIHAIADLKAHKTGKLEEESACFLAECLYYLYAGTKVDFWNWHIDGDIMDVAEAARGRAGKSNAPVTLTLSERVTVRRAVRKRGYKMGIDRSKNGIP